MALQDLNRAQDIAITTNKLAEITPVNWRKYPPPAAAITDANPNEAKPRYSVAGDWVLGVAGDDTDTATATVAIARNDGGAAEADYEPRTQAAKANLPGTVPPNAVAGEPDFVVVTDVSRPRGWIAPGQPYQGNGTAPAAPVVSSISPTTGAAATLPLLVTITGTGFTPWSVVRTGGSATPDVSGKYIDATHMSVAIFKASAGTVSVAVEDHDLLSNTDKVFTVT